jgi:hypothetical protein
MDHHQAAREHLIDAAKAMLRTAEEAEGVAVPIPGMALPTFAAVGTAGSIRRLIEASDSEDIKPAEPTVFAETAADDLGQAAYLAACEASDQTPIPWDKQNDFAKRVWRTTALTVSRITALVCADLADRHEATDEREIGAASRAHYGFD